MKLSKGSGNWLRSDQVKKGDVVMFMDEGRIEDSTMFTYDDGKPVKQLLFTVSFNGENRTLKVNKPSRMNLIESWGDETKNWISKSARINLIPSNNGKSKMIVLEPEVEIKWDK